MKDKEMENQLKDLVTRYNGLKHKSGVLNFGKNIMSKDYYLTLMLGEGIEHVIYITPYMSEMEGVLIGLLISTDFDYFGKSTRNPMYRFVPTPKAYGKSGIPSCDCHKKD